ncbi:uncharacterized protein LY79DRAFT_260992 [Colletotrichum navitas]|uniref:Uncharacterized protein n=1 Tax=Colletotrichum navitas TaxID=681940 RepID=A0AAD8PXD8_9PEZI|nr:uncharacterized protein LY79DRAFT_260992 [Colletotrichum navitas]KAK1585809.1 hypothetical protein LY79DRAFT_260992 [Colletotrichum navitas]
MVGASWPWLGISKLRTWARCRVSYMCSLWCIYRHPQVSNMNLTKEGGRESESESGRGECQANRKRNMVWQVRYPWCSAHCRSIAVGAIVESWRNGTSTWANCKCNGNELGNCDSRTSLDVVEDAVEGSASARYVLCRPRARCRAIIPARPLRKTYCR